MSPIIYEFVISFQKWIDAGMPVHNQWGYSKAYGVCYSLRIYCYYNIIATSVAHELADELESAFEYSHGTANYPFGGESKFHIEIKNGTLYENPKRLEWIKKHAQA